MFNIWYQISYCLKWEGNDINQILFERNNLNFDEQLELKMYLISPSIFVIQLYYINIKLN